MKSYQNWAEPIGNVRVQTKGLSLEKLRVNTYLVQNTPVVSLTIHMPIILYKYITFTISKKKLWSVSAF